MIITFENWKDGISVRPLKISNIRYADDTTLFADKAMIMAVYWAIIIRWIYQKLRTIYFGAKIKKMQRILRNFNVIKATF